MSSSLHSALNEDHEIDRFEATAMADAQVLASGDRTAIDRQARVSVAPALHDERDVFNRRIRARGERERQIGLVVARSFDDPRAPARIVLAACETSPLDCQPRRALPRARQRCEIDDAAIGQALEMDLRDAVARPRERLPIHVRERRVAGPVGGQGIAPVRRLERRGQWFHHG